MPWESSCTEIVKKSVMISRGKVDRRVRLAASWLNMLQSSTNTQSARAIVAIAK